MEASIKFYEKKGNLVHIVPTCTGSRKGFDPLVYSGKFYELPKNSESIVYTVEESCLCSGENCMIDHIFILENFIFHLAYCVTRKFEYNRLHLPLSVLAEDKVSPQYNWFHHNTLFQQLSLPMGNTLEVLCQHQLSEPIEAL
jgi:hypothetical protein